MTGRGVETSTKSDLNNLSRKLEWVKDVVSSVFSNWDEDKLKKYVRSVNDEYFPSKKERLGQFEAFNRLYEEYERHIKSNNSKPKVVRLIARTGHGKTHSIIAFLTKAIDKGLARNAVIITIRNRLQSVIPKRFGNHCEKFGIQVVPLIGKEKECNNTEKFVSGTLPCKNKVFINGKTYFITGFKDLYEYPCENCKFEEKKEMLSKNKVIAVLNHGNYFYAKEMDVVVIDEADITLESILQSLVLGYDIIKASGSSVDEPVEVILEKVRNYFYNTSKKLLTRLQFIDEKEVKSKKSEIERINNTLRNCRMMLEKVELFLKVAKIIEIVKIMKGYSLKFKPIIWDKDLDELAKAIFPHAKFIVLSSATLSERENAIIMPPIPFAAKTIYVPVGNLSRTNTEKRGNSHLIKLAVDFATDVGHYVGELMSPEPKKFVIHVSNTDWHGRKAYEYLLSVTDKEKIVRHTVGRYNQSLDEFIKNKEKEWLIISAAERGEDIKSLVQFVINIPWDKLDEELEQVKKHLGEEKFNKWYAEKAFKRIVQICGRNARDPEDLAFTIILDKNFEELIKRIDESIIPTWFAESFEFKNKILYFEDQEFNGRNG